MQIIALGARLVWRFVLLIVLSRFSNMTSSIIYRVGARSIWTGVLVARFVFISPARRPILMN